MCNKEVSVLKVDAKKKKKQNRSERKISLQIRQISKWEKKYCIINKKGGKSTNVGGWNLLNGRSKTTCPSSDDIIFTLQAYMKFGLETVRIKFCRHSMHEKSGAA